MKLNQKLPNIIYKKSSILVTLISLLAICGSTQMIYGGMWDAISHIIKAPEYFWSIQHVVVYIGVSMVATSGILGFLILQNTNLDKNLKWGIKLVIIGAILQIGSGYADSVSHDIYGIDGLVSWSHQPLELGLLLSALGAFFIIKSDSNLKLKKLLPAAILTLIFSIMWLAFNFALLVGGVILCFPVYQIFSSGCSVL